MVNNIRIIRIIRVQFILVSGFGYPDYIEIRIYLTSLDYYILLTSIKYLYCIRLIFRHSLYYKAFD